MLSVHMLSVYEVNQTRFEMRVLDHWRQMW